MTSRDDLTEDQLVELEELRDILYPRLGGLSSIAKAYGECDIDKLRAMEALVDGTSSIVTPLKVSLAVDRLRRLHHVAEVSHLVLAEQLEAEREVYVLMERARIAKGISALDSMRSHCDAVVDFVFLNVLRTPHVLSIIAAGHSDADEIIAIVESMSDQSLVLAEGTL